MDVDVDVDVHVDVDVDVDVVVCAVRGHLAELRDRAIQDARATPPALGWPDPMRARAMAEHFATLLDPSMALPEWARADLLRWGHVSPPT